MSFNQKVLLLSLCILIAIPVGGFWYYRQLHPRYVPPPPREEMTITLIPGWNLRQVADYLVQQGFASTSGQIFNLVGVSAIVYGSRAQLPPLGKIDLEYVQHKPSTVSYEGYLAPETYRVFRDASIKDILEKFLTERNTEITELLPDGTKNIKPSNGRVPSSATIHDIITMGSIIEKETRHDEDRALVSDILWRRLQKGWALQVDSSVHYAVNRTGDVFTTAAERAVDSPWNTYKYPGLPPGPICNPGMASVRAALYPAANDYWYFLTGSDGIMRYARTLDEHNANRLRYLR